MRPIRPRRRWLSLPLLAALALALPPQADAQSRRDELLLPGASRLAPAGEATDPAIADLSARLERLERMLTDRGLSDFVLQFQRLQQDVQDLRGQLELQQYRLQQLSPDLPSFSGGRLGAGAGAAPGEPGAEAAAGSDATAAAGSPVAGEPGSAAAPADAGAAPQTAETGTGTGAAAEAPALPTAPPPKQGLGSLGAGSGSGGVLALPSPETVEGSEREAYRAAFEQLKARDYAAAKQELGAMLVQWPQGQYADSGVYWLGEIGYVTKDYSAALTHFNRLINDYPLSPKLPGAMLKLGYVYSEQQDFDKARAMLEEVARRFPDTTEGRLARGRLAQMTREGG